ncbi:hypothetical protein [Lacticaseibacillus brantae]|nr:hypothetical protein [Lacticaseibacillus brantae]
MDEDEFEDDDFSFDPEFGDDDEGEFGASDEQTFKGWWFID